MEQKVLISDYDDTITKGSDSTFSKVSSAVIGFEEFERIKTLPSNLGKEWFGRYINENSLTIEKAQLMWNNFKETELYQKFVEANNSSINEVLAKGENMPNNNITEFYIKQLTCPLIALYNVYIEKLTPEESFFELYKKVKAEGDILIINTLKPQETIIVELREYAKINGEKYKAFEEMIENQMVFGTIYESCKVDSNRINFLLKSKSDLLKTPTQEIIIMGDSFTDCVNFQEAHVINPSSSKFLFVETRLEETIKSLSEKVDKLRDNAEELTKATAKLKHMKNELNQINEQIKKTPQNIIKGTYSNIASRIYR